jgi:hypothetical protein
VHDAPGLVLLGIDAPDLLDPGLEGLRVRPLQIEALDQLPREAAADTFP